MRKQLSFKNITFLTLLITAILGSMWIYEVKVARPAMSYMGMPKGEHDLKNLVHILRNRAYLVGYSEWLGNPLWVTYKIIPKRYSYIGPRPPFKADWRSPFPVEPEDYRHSHYDRGHMAPNYLIASRYGRAAQEETFLMTNITPQKSHLNQKAWQRLEEVAADYFSKWYPEIWVITGPIFDSDPPRFKLHPRIAIPKAFYKVFIRPGTPEDPTPKMLAFIMPQTASAKASLMKFVVSVDTVEAATGLDFNSELPDPIENQVEAQSHPEQWHLKRVAKLKARY
ncbi:DNA/RNA non-specific endonuclease [Galenea microaerophila]